MRAFLLQLPKLDSPKFSCRRLFVALLLNCVLVTAVTAQKSEPTSVPLSRTIPVSRDIEFPGTMKLMVDATDVQQGIFRVKQSIPLNKAGPIVLLSPAWLPGVHSAGGQIEKLTGLTIVANGNTLPWKRDSLDMWAFHIDVPEGVKALDIEFQFVSPTAPDQGRIVVAPNMMNLQWNHVSLYPAGYYTRRIPVKAIATFPEGWAAVAGLPAKKRGRDYVYEETDYETLVDSPVFAGRYYRRWQLSDRVALNVFADKPSELEASPEQIETHRRLVDQTVKLFGTQHYDKYEFLLAITEQMGRIGLEHHRSSENAVSPGYFTNWESGPGSRNLLPHELVHSWNGKFRRGADSWTPDFRTPMRNSLLWVYEGQTQFWGYVLQARSGIVSKQDTLDTLASIAARLDSRPARSWRPLIDTTNNPIISRGVAKGWPSWQRPDDYYNEGLLLWLEIDSILRQESDGKKSMNDFARQFFGLREGDWGVVTYDFDEVVETLSSIQPYNWEQLLKNRLEGIGEEAPLTGLEANGYRLVFTDKPTAAFKNSEERSGQTNLRHSLGIVVEKGGSIRSVMWDSPAFEKGLDVADTIIAVSGKEYSANRLLAAIDEAQSTKKPIKLLIKSGARYRDVSIRYSGGLRYPRLEKIGKEDGGLDHLLMPL